MGRLEQACANEVSKMSFFCVGILSILCLKFFCLNEALPFCPSPLKGEGQNGRAS